MKLDPIVKEALWRSVVVFFVSVIIVATAPLPIPAFLLFPLALTVAAVYFMVMVRYGRKAVGRSKSHAYPPSFPRVSEYGEGEKMQRRVVVEKVTDAVLLVTVFLIYLYASLAYSIN